MDADFEDFQLSDLNRMKNFLTEKILEYNNKQKQVREKVDTLLSECSIGVERDELSGILQAGTTLENLLVKHIRQRNETQLIFSRKLYEVIYVTIEQTLIFRKEEQKMEEFKIIEKLIENYVKTNIGNSHGFLSNAGQLTSQQIPDIDEVDEEEEDNDYDIDEDEQSRKLVRTNHSLGSSDDIKNPENV
jgi:hypothetical protein